MPHFEKTALSAVALAALGFAIAAPASASVALSTTYTENTTAYTGNYGGTVGTGAAGFGAFSITNTTPTGTYAGEFLGSASASEGGAGNQSSLDTGGNSFGYYANGSNAGAIATIDQNFSSLTEPLGLATAGDTFSIQFVPGTNYNGSSGVSLLTGSGATGAFVEEGPYNTNPPVNSSGSAASSTAGFYFNGAAAALSASPDPNPGVITLTYTLTSPTGYNFTASGPVTYSGTGTLTGPVTGFEVQGTYSGGGGGDQNGYFNNISYTSGTVSAAPEPSQVGLLAILGLGIGGLLLQARKRKNVTA